MIRGPLPDRRNLNDACSLYDDDKQGSGGLSSLNATVSEGAPLGGAQKAAEIQKLSPTKSGKKSGGQSWLMHSDQHALELSKVTDNYSIIGLEA